MPVQRTPPISRRHSESEIKPSNPFEASAIQNITSNQDVAPGALEKSNSQKSTAILTQQDEESLNLDHIDTGVLDAFETNDHVNKQNAAKRQRDSEKEISLIRYQMNELQKSLDDKIRISQNDLFCKLEKLIKTPQTAAMSSTHNHTLGSRLSSVPDTFKTNQTYSAQTAQASTATKASYSFLNDSQYSMNQKIKNNHAILSNPTKIPKFKSSEQSVMLFLNDKILSFAEQFSVAETELVAQWVHLAFSETNHKKIRLIVNKIVNKSIVNIDEFLIKLARTLDPLATDTISTKSLTRRVALNEGLVDYFLRLKIEMKGTRYRKSEHNSKIIEYAIEYEPSPSVKLEIKREFSDLERSDEISDDLMIEKLSKIDNFCELGLVAKDSPKNTDINAFSNKQDYKKSEKSEFRSATCKQCGEIHYEFTRAGYEYYDCRNCAIKLILEDNNLPSLWYDLETHRPSFWNEKSKQYTPFPKAILQEVGKNYPMTSRSKTYDSRLKRKLRPPRNNNYNKNSQFNQRITRSNSESDAIKASKNKQNAFFKRYDSCSNLQDTNLPKLEELTGDAKNSDSWGNVSNVKGPDDILEALTEHKLNSKVEKARVVANCSIGLHEEKALIDTGAFRNVISRALVQKLGQRCNVKASDITKCTGFDGSVTELDGEITLDLNIGSLSYRGPFLVVPSLSYYPLILGEPFLSQNGLMTRLERNLKEICGEQAISRGN